MNRSQLRPGAKLPALCIAFLICFTGIARAADEKPTTQPSAPIIWKLQDPKSVGGMTPEIWGAPTGSADGIHFNGSSDGLVFSSIPIKGWSQFTIEALFKPDPDGQEEQRFMHIEDSAARRCMMEIRLKDKVWALDTFLLGTGGNQLPLLDRTKVHPADKWTWVALVSGDGKEISYINGQKELEGNVNMSPMVDGKMSLGVRQNKLYWFKGTIKEVRFHPVALEPGKLQHAD